MVDLTWLGHASFMIDTGQVIIYLDPYELGETPADYILATHDHYDHSDIETIGRIRHEKTRVITTPYTALKLTRPVDKILPGEKRDLPHMKIRTVHAYNIDKPYHLKGFGLGFIIELDNLTIYHTGDTDLIQEIQKVRDIDILLVPVDGIHGLSSEDAARLTGMIKPRIAIPMHYGTVPEIGSYRDAEKFRDLVANLSKGTEVKIMEIGETIRI